MLGESSGIARNPSWSDSASRHFGFVEEMPLQSEFDLGQGEPGVPGRRAPEFQRINTRLFVIASAFFVTSDGAAALCPFSSSWFPVLTQPGLPVLSSPDVCDHARDYPACSY